MRTKAGRSIRFWSVWNGLGLICGIAAAYLIPVQMVQRIAALSGWIKIAAVPILFAAGYVPAGWSIAPLVMAAIGILCSAPLRICVTDGSFDKLLLTVARVGLPMAWLIPWGLLTASYSALCAWNRYLVLCGKPRKFDAASHTKTAWMRFFWTLTGTAGLELLVQWVL